MNERIRELYVKAYGYFPAPIGEPELEKFAELIVKECAEIAYNKQYKHSAAHTRGDCAEAIKQHFGVKE